MRGTLMFNPPSLRLVVIAIVILPVTAVLAFRALEFIGLRELEDRCLRHPEIHCPERPPR